MQVLQSERDDEEGVVNLLQLNIALGIMAVVGAMSNAYLVLLQTCNNRTISFYSHTVKNIV